MELSVHFCAFFEKDKNIVLKSEIEEDRMCVLLFNGGGRRRRRGNLLVDVVALVVWFNTYASNSEGEIV